MGLSSRLDLSRATVMRRVVRRTVLRRLRSLTGQRFVRRDAGPGGRKWVADRPLLLSGCPVPDAIFAEPRLADIYDALDPDRSDLETYLAVADELDARSVLDIGCGTGTLACQLAERGSTVTGLDPAGASLRVARRKPYANQVRWLHGQVESLPPLQADLATMTGNVAQVFVTETAWAGTLRAVRASLRPGGALVFETRDPARRAWRAWTRELSERRVTLPGVGIVRTWVEVTDVDGPLVSFRHTFVFERDGAVLTSDSMLRFRSQAEITDSLKEAGFVVQHVRDAPDRPGLELVFVAKRGA